jgi:CheY-like chemotaxis protein
LSELAPLINAQYGTIYQMVATENDSHLKRLAGYAVGSEQSEAAVFGIGQGLIGQCASEKRRIHVADIPADYVRIHSSLGSAVPRHLIVLPLLFEGETKAVLELASVHPYTRTHIVFLEQLTQSIGVVLNTIEANMRTEALLRQSQELTAELQTRQTELQKTNEELAEKARQLAEQNEEVERKNNEVEQARRALEEKAAELALTSKYKSEFMANMSHELRTPLNSILILGQQLAINASGNLTNKQVEWAKNVYSSGSELLNLITDILDLSKIESGTVTVEFEETTFASLRDTIERNFRHVAEAKNLPFIIELDSALPDALTTDPKRLHQILKNLLSNAFKFTSIGQVTFQVSIVTTGWSAVHPILTRSPQVLAFAVRDTGIGIAPDKQKLVFEAFQQADASTSRKYGGTGLGLAISRELAGLLGGEIRLSSNLNEGSVFTLYLPLSYTGPSTTHVRPATEIQGFSSMWRPSGLPVLARSREEEIVDDRDCISPDDSTLLVIEDDPHYARILMSLARGQGFKVLIAQQGTAGLTLAREFKPTAISLDIFLPDMLGWTVLNNLKLDSATRHIPVQVISCEEQRHHGLSRGAFAYLVKPTTTEDIESSLLRLRDYARSHTKRLLIVEDNTIERKSIIDLLKHDDIEIEGVGTGEEAFAALLDKAFDCIILDLRLPDMTGFELLEKIQSEPTLHSIPVVVFTGKELTTEEESKLKLAAKTVVLKDVHSPERLLDETSLFLHRVVTRLPEDRQEMLRQLHSSNTALRGRKVLVVDDDARNIYALATVLEAEDMDVLSATNGRQAIETIRATPDIAVVLMDIMMPEMDGFQTMKEIRQESRFRSIPIVALTAKAMKGDREKCLVAGASDYIAKPVNTDQLLSLLRIWSHR